jgi:hypothetical protein
MNCPHCGAQNEDGARFCGNCGSDLSSFQTAQPAQNTYTPDYSNQPTYQDTSSAYGASSQQYSDPYAQQSQQQYSDPYAQQPQQYSDPYAQQPQQYADPYAGQQPQNGPYQQQYPQGYNAPQQPAKKGFPVLPVVIGAVALVLVVGAFLIFRGGSGGGGNTGGGTTGGGTTTGGGNSGGGGTTVETPAPGVSLGDTYSDSTYGYSFQAPDGASAQTDTSAGKIQLRYTNPDMWVNTYVGDGGGNSPSDVAANINERYSMTTVEVGSDYCICVGTDNDGDTNYTKVICRGDALIFMDVYYHPSDESTQRDVAFAIMNSFTA